MADWKKKLGNLFEHKTSGEQDRNIRLDSTAVNQRKAAEKFLCTVVYSTFRDLALEFYKYERKAYIFEGSKHSRELEIRYRNIVEFRYVVKVYTGTVKNTLHTSYMSRYETGREELGEGIIMKNGKQADITDLTRDDIIKDFLNQYLLRHTHSSF